MLTSRRAEALLMTDLGCGTVHLGAARRRDLYMPSYEEKTVKVETPETRVGTSEVQY